MVDSHQVKNLPGEESRRPPVLAVIHMIRLHPRAWACLFVYGAILFEVALIEPYSTAIRLLMLGYLALSILTSVGWLIYETSVSHRNGNTRLGQEATNEAVITWRRRSTDWNVVKGLANVGDLNVGHVLVGPGGVYAIKSTWTPHNCDLHQGAIVGLHGREPVAQAQESARSIQQLLLDSPEHLVVTVHPVVVVWGPGGLHLDDGWTDVNGTLICEGGKGATWLEHIEGTELDRRSVDRITEVLANQGRRKTDRSDSRIEPSAQALGA